ncbi:hypothetical protein HSX10_15750 [Winogradskyella undariae]|uniref:hypothetical protein n=1 Tax=Winogradskyella TaxID=286104 RepID=UPI00156BA171|nr:MULTISPECIES: hypothetical protein [Winogradskyella]NRR93030.1 hypothetical protein [Winogradskyella undariae]QXP79354.1 hypothetical protein H0I32_01500 [Winogradskyella sp. HaHa_3_26]
MKYLLKSFYILCFFIAANPIFAQELEHHIDFNSPIYDRAEDQLTSTDTIPDFRSKKNKLKLTGTIYLSDGVTPAKDVILFIEQPNENGDFDLRKTGDDRYVFHRSWVKTDANGKYTLYTFIPGGDRRYNQLQQIFPLIKTPSKPVYAVESLLFEEDPLLTKRCVKRMMKKGDVNRILKLKSEDGILVAEHNITLESDNTLAKL